MCTKLSNGEDFVLDLSLNHLIVPNSAVSKVMASKVGVFLSLCVYLLLMIKYVASAYTFRLFFYRCL